MFACLLLRLVDAAGAVFWMGTSVAVVVVFGSASFVPLPVLIPLLLLPVLLVELLLELELLLLELLLLLSLSFRLVEGAAVAVGTA